jgi:hypothetical protein
MRRSLTVFAIFTLAFCTTAHAQRSTPVTVANDVTAPVPVMIVSPDTPYVFVGFSTETRFGNAGFVGMNAACQEVFGENARFASTREFILSPVAGGLGGTAWIRPEIIGGHAFGTRGVVEFSGLVDEGARLSCFNWRSNSSTDTGLVVSSGGRIHNTSQTCDRLRPVACSAPAQ